MPEPYTEQFPVGTRVRIADRDALKRFQGEWRRHNPLQAQQLAFAGHEAIVREVGYYHGGDVLYTLDRVPGVWHEPCLERA
jgi:hypothetical protein